MSSSTSLVVVVVLTTSLFLSLSAGFDPFHETQKGLADLLESESKAAEAQQLHHHHQHQQVSTGSANPFTSREKDADFRENIYNLFLRTF